MTTAEMKDIIEKLQKENYPAFVKALVSIELGIKGEDELDALYEKYMKDDKWYLLDYKFYAEP